ncbi:hypothetical protein DICSQDRAFT_130488 [Dichomitus squalens LYAD-421 SS1]|uniref:GIT Spa2 homology (SHD) domain-containing protein n=1 Tax=Dichomitus squalens (strain LYAD-421) TaxID=732165 RepID=R7SIQ9_DICSQ|nr:uncharacterized protein DICSQDRAFT_130488 [Dichomitus squalens LYAD-421 SS1]EJF55728.1 hypothetical protein DICSQDRAFT_130488 [Dichomitus squalens LYAD-421 SS1]
MTSAEVPPERGYVLLFVQPANSRTTARQKLTRLTRQQFQELSTDVYDELIRRKNNSSDNEARTLVSLVPFLPVRDDFHPKRNQARQKLATLPTGRFKDLSSDVYYELARRYPEFKEETPDAPTSAVSAGSAYDDFPSPDFPRNGRTSEDRGNDSGYGGSTPGASTGDTYSRRKPSQDIYSGSDRRRPSQDTTLGRRPSESASVTSGGDAQSATAGMGMIIPNKSTIAEEEIEVPYGRDSNMTARNRNGGGLSDSERDLEDDVSPRSPPERALGGLSGLSARLQQADDGEDYYDRASYGRQSVASDRSAGGGSKALGGRTSVAGEDERMRREYEFKIATMQKRIAGLERDLEDVQDREQKWADGEDRVRAMEQELNELRRRVEEKGSSMLSLQQELDALREERARERDIAERRQRQDQDEIQMLRDRCEVLESGDGAAGSVDAAILDQLRSDMEGLMAELSDLSRRNDELQSEKDNDLAFIRELEGQVKEYKRKYEQAKTELRSAKATSQLFLKPPKVDDQLPVARDGGLVDVHVTGFVSSIDSLLTAGRSNAPTQVLQPMKGVINAVTAIIEDVRVFERRPPRDRAEVDLDALQSLRDRLDATLSNLVAAAKTHATSAGMSPVSLLDAAASHVSATVTEIGKTVHIRKATKAEQDAFMPSSSSSATNGYAPSLRSVEELRSTSSPSHQRSGSSTSLRGGDDRYNVSPSSSPRVTPRRPPSNMSSSNASSPPPLFDKPKVNGNSKNDSSASGEGPEDAWAELKPYLEAQTESIVYAIQSVLSGVRSPTPSPTLNENLTQIITIVSSIVAVCKDNLPPASKAQGEEILRELGEHANKLSEVQAQADITKESRQVMAKSSFAVANAMKGLMKL